MKNSSIYLASVTVLKQKLYLITFIAISLIIFAILVIIPAKTIPGNDIVFQLKVIGYKGISLLLILSVLTGLSITMNLYLFRRRLNTKTSISLVGHGAFGSLSGFVGSIFGTATCSACVSSIFGFLGVGGILFLLKYRLLITLTAIILILISLYFNSRKVLGICNSCKI